MVRVTRIAKQVTFFSIFRILFLTSAYPFRCETYNATAGANIALANDMQEAIDTAYETIDYLEADKSHGFHNPAWIMEELNAAYVDLLNAKATFYEQGGGAVVDAAGFSADMLIIVAGSIGGIVIGLVLGILVGRRR